jgi:DNA-binding Lrp family transcriptional regulator
VDTIDRAILNAIQANFPVCEEPFKTVALELGLSESEIIARIAQLKREGIIRRIGAVFDPEKLGFVSTLCAARVPEEKVKAFSETVSAHPGVTHNYRRNHAYNIWFTITARNQDELTKSIAEIREKTNVADIISMGAVKKFKIKVNFSL